MIVRVGGEQRLAHDLYHALLQSSWKRLLATIASVYIGINALFAGAYVAGGDCVSGAQPGSFSDAFFFSVQTFSTIGYGTMAPKGTYASVVVSVEAFVGLVMVAMATGLMFSKFSRPTARVLFSKKMVVTRRHGRPTLLMRMANERGNDILEANIRITILRSEVTPEGDQIRRLYDLPLVRGDTPLFTIAFTAMHVVDEKSPLHNATSATLEAGEVRFIVSVAGHDATFGQTIHARYTYYAEDVVWNARFLDVMSTLPDGRLQLDYTKFHDVEPQPQ